MHTFRLAWVSPLARCHRQEKKKQKWMFSGISTRNGYDIGLFRVKWLHFQLPYFRLHFVDFIWTEFVEVLIYLLAFVEAFSYIQKFRLIGANMVSTMWPVKAAVQIIRSKDNNIFQFCYWHFIQIKCLLQLKYLKSPQSAIYYPFSI